MAAGLGFKTFTTGEVLTAADTNGYLMQGVLVFASAAARDAAITSPQEGQCCYLKDTDAVLTYSGAAWVGFDDSNAIQNSIVDAKGDLISATAADTPARLAVGTNGQTLVADSSTSTGLKWAAAAGGGKVLQVVYGSSTTDTTVSSGTFTDTTLSASITPSLATSKVLVLVSLVSGGANSGTVFQTNVRLLRGATSVWEPAYSSYPSMNNGGASSVELNGPIPINYLDSPATTSATTYKMQGRREQAAGSARFQFGGSISTIILLEIGA